MTDSPATNGEELDGRSIVVSGGTTGIGRATAILLASQGARLLIFGRHEKELNNALHAIREAGGEAHGVVADQSRMEDVRKVFAQADRLLGGVDVLVNNAAIERGALTEHQLEDIHYVVNSNLIGYLACTHEAVTRMERRGAGHIVNIGSMSADLREEENSVYVATKAAIQGFSESLRKTVNPKGIKVTLIEPGKVATEMVDLSNEEKESREAESKMLRPEDIAGCVLYCLSQPKRCNVVQVQLRPLLQVI